MEPHPQPLRAAAIAVAIVAVLATAAYFLVRSPKAVSEVTPTPTATSTPSAKASPSPTPTPTPSPTPTPTKAADSANTLTSPTKVTSADSKTYFIYGAPAGQNNKTTKKIIISLPGHGTTADDGYVAWKNHLSGDFALAEFNWWDGGGEKTTNYYQPSDVVMQARAFLNQQGYKSGDTVILHGFSRGSANTYAVIFQDHLKGAPVFDAVISNAGKYQSDFPLASKTPTDAEITAAFKNIPWVLACGGKDDNPDRDGCPGMAETSTFLTSHGANVVGTVTDLNGGHGAFHMSSLGLPKQALSLLDAAL